MRLVRCDNCGAQAETHAAARDFNPLGWCEVHSLSSRDIEAVAFCSAECVIAFFQKTPRERARIAARIPEDR